MFKFVNVILFILDSLNLCTAGKISIEHVTIFLSKYIYLYIYIYIYSKYKVLLTWHFHQMLDTIQVIHTYKKAKQKVPKLSSV